MLRLRQLLADYSPLLLLDAATEVIQVGLLAAAAEPQWSVRPAEAGTGLFAGLASLGVDLGTVRSFAFCEGPGSILGIRTSAMALRTWQVLGARPQFAYQSLALAAAGLDRPELSLIADARRGRWHHYAPASGLRRLPAADLAGPLGMPVGMRHWSPLPEGLVTVPYDLPRLCRLPAVLDTPLFRPTDEPDAFLHEEPAYAMWSPHVHRAP